MAYNTFLDDYGKSFGQKMTLTIILAKWRYETIEK